MTLIFFRLDQFLQKRNGKNLILKVIAPDLQKSKKLINIHKKNKLFGNDMIFGLMPDWNPVEMIGYQPNALSYSLYETLITNDAWSKSRTLMGYKNVNRH